MSSTESFTDLFGWSMEGADRRKPIETLEPNNLNVEAARPGDDRGAAAR